MKRKRNTTGITGTRIWHDESMEIWKTDTEHVLYSKGESVFSAKTFEEVYGQSRKIRGE